MLIAPLNLSAMREMSSGNSSSSVSLRGGCNVHATCCEVYAYVSTCQCTVWACEEYIQQRPNGGESIPAKVF